MFASLDRKKSGTLLPPSSGGESRLDSDRKHAPVSSNAQKTDDSATRALNTQYFEGIKEEVHKNLPSDKHGHHEGEPAKRPSSSNEITETKTAAWPSTSSSEPVWDFESLLEEQRQKEMKYADQKEKIFEKVALWGYAR